MTLSVKRRSPSAAVREHRDEPQYVVPQYMLAQYMVPQLKEPLPRRR